MKKPLLVSIIQKLKKRFHLRTYHFELGGALLFLSGVALYSGKGYIEWIGVAAVFFSFAHTSVADRLAEVQAKEQKEKKKATVECFYKLNRYFYLKEVCWSLYFFLLGAWSALAGVILFLLYPMWRAWWRRYESL